MDGTQSKSKGGLSIAIILLAVVIGFGFVIGLTQTDAAKNLNSTNTEISNYVYDEEGTLIAYTGTLTELEIPQTYSLSSTVEEVQMTSSSIYSLIEKANTLGIKKYKIENQTGNYTDDFGNVYYQEKYIMTYERRKTIEGDDYTTTKIGTEVFYNNSRITSIVLPETVTQIGSRAFCGAGNLKTINLPEHLERIENSAFFNCRLLNSIEIPNSVEYIGPQAFQECVKLKEINIPTNMTYISSMSFSNCTGLTKIVIPSNITNIQSEAFAYCYNLKEIEFNEGLRSVGNMAFYNCYNLQEIELPSTLTQISSQAFYRCDALRNITLNSIMVPNISGSSSFPNNVVNIYVVDELYDTYLNNSMWNNYYYDKIRMISEKTA